MVVLYLSNLGPNIVTLFLIGQTDMVQPSLRESASPEDDDADKILTRRRGAIKKAKIHEHRGHKFQAHYFRHPTFCSYCSEFCW